MATIPRQVKRMPSIVPPVEEQRHIADSWIQSSTRPNDSSQKQRLIELPKEQKQNIINRAVTRRLDPNVRLKPGGVEWVEDIPEHWEDTKLKRVVSFNPSKV